MELHRHTLALKIVLVAILGIVLTACGGGDEEEEPTATTEPGAAQPTVAETPDDEVVDLVSTPEVGPDSTPAGNVPVNTDMSSPDSQLPPATPGDGGAATPTSAMVNEAETATPEPPTTDGTPETGTEGTVEEAVDDTAATPAGDEPVDAADDVPGDGTTGAADVDDVAEVDSATTEASPPANGGQATPEVSAEPVIVEGCEIAEIPPYTGETTTYVLSVDVNFRAGPGTDCDVIGDGPLGEFTSVEIIGGPVVRADDEEFQWVQVQVGESTGWLAFEFLEPPAE